MTGWRIEAGGLDDPRVVALLAHHRATARAATAAGSAHALDAHGLAAPGIAFFTLRGEDEAPLATGALRRLSAREGEIKSMHVAAVARRQGAGSAMLAHLLAEARAAGLARVSLETGSWDYFAPAWALYRAHGFVDCAPFGDYGPDRNSRFMTLALDTAPAPRQTGGED